MFKLKGIDQAQVSFDNGASCSGRADVKYCQPNSPVIVEFCYPHVVGGMLLLW